MAERTKLIPWVLAFLLVGAGAFAQTQPAPSAQPKPAPAAPAQATPAQAKPSGSYPTAVVDAFIGGCGRESGGRTEFCRCLIDGLQKKLNFAEFKRWETAGALGMQVPQTINEKVLDVATQCRWPD
jgi:hypothetical protein